MTSRRRVELGVQSVLALFVADFVFLLVSGSGSLLASGPVSTSGAILRAASITALVLIRWHVLVPSQRRPAYGTLVLALLILPTLLQFHVAGGRINGDGLSYYVFVRSLVKDRDFDLTNEYTHYGMITRGDLKTPTRTGLRRSIYSVGPAIVWTPFFVAGEITARVARALSADVDLSGYGPYHRNAVALGSLLYGYAGLWLVFALLCRHFARSTALASVLLLWGGSFVHWYMVWQPTYSHSASFCLAGMALWVWDRSRNGRDPWGFFFLGVVIGLGMCVRWQNGVLLWLPGLELLAHLHREPRRWGKWLGLGGLLGLGVMIGACPQMIAWKALYGEWLLRHPPHGADFLRLDHPFILETLFSSRHGLLSWSPVLWMGYLGFVGVVWKRPRLGWPLLPLVLGMTYVNMCSGDWWAGASYSNRRFDSLLPILALGIAVSVDGLRSAFRRHPQLALATLAIPFVMWNAMLAEQTRRALIPRDDVVRFGRLTRLGTELLNGWVGFPTTWPASWLFAAEHGLSPARYDRLVGKYLFYRQNNLDGNILVGTNDDALLGEGWGRVEQHDGVSARRLEREARVFAPLDTPLHLEMRLRCRTLGEGTQIQVRVNGMDAGGVWSRPEWTEPVLRVPSAFWKERLNEVVLVAPDDSVLVAAVVFARGPA
jgi:hypothetical protein